MSAPTQSKAGVYYALAAFTWWGLVPIYFKAISHVDPLDILCHRVVWSVPLTALLISAARGWRSVGMALTRRVFITLVGTAFLAASNWFVFIYAISNNQVLQTSLGYFLNPLINVVLGMIFLRERLRPWQGVAVGLAAIGTLNLAWKFGGFPWISLFLALSFGFYGLLRKTVKIESLNGLFVETTLLCPLAIGYLVYLGFTGAGAFGTVDWQTTFLLLLAGMVTALPLVWFTSGARRLPYTTVGVVQYVAPSLQFILAVFAFNEPFTTTHLVTFICIWTGLAVFMADSFAHQRQALKLRS